MRSKRFWISRIAVLAFAVALGLWLQGVTAEYLGSLQTLAEEHPQEARAKLALLFRAMAVGLFGGTALLGLHLAMTCRRALRLAQFPPPGAWGFGAARIWHGAAAQRIARAMGVLSLALVVCSLAGSAVSWHIASVLLACRAP